MRDAGDRTILHLDIPAFPVAVERVMDARLRQRPVAIAPVGGARPQLLAVSGEARREGIEVGMFLPQALRRCRDLVVLNPNRRLYGRAAEAFDAVLSQYSPLVEPNVASGTAGGVGIGGAAAIDLSGTRRLFGEAKDVTWKLQKELFDRLRLESTAGLASNKLVSRIAADILIPTRLQDIFQGYEAAFLAPLPVAKLPSATSDVIAVLRELNLQRIGQVARLELEDLTLAFGPFGRSLYRQARGEDDEPVRPVRKLPYIEEAEELADDTNLLPELEAALARLVRRAAHRLRGIDKRAGRCAVRVRYADNEATEYAAPLPQPSNLDALLFRLARRLLHQGLERRVRVRELSVCFAALEHAPVQLAFPGTNAAREAEITAAVEALQRRFGKGVVRRGEMQAGGGHGRLQADRP
jgi:DNA polymerase-4